MGWDVFFSYPRVDTDAAEVLYDRLRATGLKVFRDQNDIRDATSISATIINEMAESRLVVAWYSTAYGRSRACQWELTAAILAGAAEGNPAGRVLVVNPLPGLNHLQPRTLRDALVLPADDLDEAVRRIRAHLATLTTPLGTVAKMDGGPWHGSRRGSSPRFVGRMAEMWTVHGVLSAPANQTALLGMQSSDTGLVHGLGGIGKSLLAEEYARRFATAYPGGTVWLSATAGNDSTELYTLALTLRLPVENETPQGVRTLVRDHLAKQGPYLWIVDDLPSDADPALLDRWRAPSDNGRTLITTRGTGLADCVTPVPLGVLSDDEAYDLLTSRQPPETDADKAAARAIVTELGRHPLALDVAGAAVRRMGYAVLRDDLADRSREVLGLAAELTGHLPGGHEPSIAATLLHSIRRLNDNGLRLLQLAALLAVAPIPRELVYGVWSAWAGRSWAFRVSRAVAQRLRRRSFHLTIPDPASRCCLDLAEKAITALDRESLIEQDDSLFLVHALVSRTIRHHASPPEALRAAAVAVLNEEMSAVKDIRNHARLADWLPHAQALSETTEDAATLALLGRLGDHDWVRGDYITATAAEHRRLNESRRVLGEEHPDTLTAMNNLATTLKAQGDIPAARALQEPALAVCRRVLGEEHPATLTSMNNLATTLKAQGDFPAARALEELALTVRRRVLGEEHPATLTSMNNLANTLSAQGDLPTARALHEQALAVRRRVLGEEHPDTLTSMNNLANTLSAQGDLPAARVLEEQALAVCRRVLGEEHPDTLTAMNNLAITLYHQGDLPAARALVGAALPVSRRTLGDAHPITRALQDVDSALAAVETV